MFDPNAAVPHAKGIKSFIFSSTILTLYASYLTDSAVLIGLVPAVQAVGYLLPQLLLARKAESLDRKKPFVVKIRQRRTRNTSVEGDARQGDPSR